jgi:beta-glucanase (GH16 family)/uncharacterized protein (DUF2237 family)
MLSISFAQSSTNKLGDIKNVSIRPSNHALTLSWDNVSGADNYTVRWGVDGKFTTYSNDKGNAYNPKTNTYTITGLKNGTKYIVAVAARNTTNRHTKGNYSKAIYATPQKTKLDTIKDISITPQNGSLKISYTPIFGADNYTVRWGVDGKFTTYSNDKGNAYNPKTNTYTITGLKNGTKYIVAVAARDSTNNFYKGGYSVAFYGTTIDDSTATTTTVPPTTIKPPTTTTKPPTSQFIGDEFLGSSVNLANWKPYYNNYGSGNNELQCLTPNNINISNGTLKIIAKRELINCSRYGNYNFTSGFLGSRDAGKYYPRYGTFEMRAKLPHGNATWPGFWLRHRNGATATNGAEVDIMEYFHPQVPGKTTSTLHLAGVKNTYKKTTFFENPTLNPGWHTWSVTIEPVPTGAKFTFLIDGKDAGSYVDTQSYKWSESAPSDGLWDMAVNMSVGGNWVGHPDGPLGLLNNGRCAQGGTAPDNCTTTGIMRTVLPVTYEVDYARYYPLQ